MKDPARSVSKITAFCCFDSPSHFSKIFKRFYHCTPREYWSFGSQEGGFHGKTCKKATGTVEKRNIGGGQGAIFIKGL
ncbi:MAG: AraC family transcriptional regulator [Lachnospiraceae bacterium]|nr:AraC family transcriptional regulator [Lachnospiraceae bacterium]